MRYIQRETYRSGVDGEPGASLGGSSGTLEVDLFVRATILERGRERRLGQRAFCWIGHRKIDKKIRDRFFPPLRNEISKSTAAPFTCAKKRDDDENATSPPARARSHRVSRALSRAMRARFRRDGVKKYTPARVVVVVVVPKGGFSACVIHLFVGAEKKRPTPKK